MWGRDMQKRNGDLVITDQVQSTKLARNQRSEDPQWRVVDLMACSVCAFADTSCSPGKMVHLLVAVWSLSESVSDVSFSLPLSGFRGRSQASVSHMPHCNEIRHISIQDLFVEM
jgi:hypothetical protein